jgi:hypothetical protein
LREDAATLRSAIRRSPDAELIGDLILLVTDESQSLPGVQGRLGLVAAMATTLSAAKRLPRHPGEFGSRRAGDHLVKGAIRGD